MTETDLDTATRTLWGECRGESFDGQVGVMWVIKNRASYVGAWWGTGIDGVCRKPFQFSCWNRSDPNLPKLVNLSKTDPSYVSLRKIVEAVLGGSLPDPTKSSTHYEVIGTNAAWAQGKVPDAVIGRHEFFNLGPGG